MKVTYNDIGGFCFLMVKWDNMLNVFVLKAS